MHSYKIKIEYTWSCQKINLVEIRFIYVKTKNLKITFSTTCLKQLLLFLDLKDFDVFESFKSFMLILWWHKKDCNDQQWNLHILQIWTTIEFI
jgi:hypothetical protein